MRSRFELTLARRLGWKPEEGKKVSPAVGVAVTGVALSMVVMLLAVAIVLGFQREVSAQAFEVDDAITLQGYGADGRSAAFDSSELLELINLPEDVEIVERTSVEGILKTNDNFLGVSLQGDERVAADSLIVISRSMASQLGLSVGDKVPVYFIINERLRTRALRVGEIYSSGIAEHDEMVAYCHAELPRKLLNLPEGYVHTLGINGVAADDVELMSQQIYSDLLAAYYTGSLNGAYSVQTIFETNPALFSWLDLLDTNVVVILVLMGAVAAFTIFSSLFIIILERVRTIGLLKSMGATNGQVRRIFMLMAERLVLRGLLIGNVVGIALIVLQKLTHIIPLDSASYFVEYVPVEISVVGIVALNVGALALSWLVLMLPALMIAKISPATTMRYE